ncbi:MAG: phosphoenolpyruvate synthase [Dehalococcoidia bacterium]|nr:MAG: phosphoenolpyruvate synthase [Dehalococcoidia bacterium]
MGDTANGAAYPLSTGLIHLDELLQGLRPGDNVVWQIESLADFAYFAVPFAREALREGRACVYLRFAEHPPLLPATDGIDIIRVDASSGFDSFTTELHAIIESHSASTTYIFDNLSFLVSKWATDELVANFFQVTCPFILQLGALAYFPLIYGKHSHETIARIKSTTQILINVYKPQGVLYVHPQKVWERYSSQMFLAHCVEEPAWQPVFQSGEAAAISSTSFPQPLVKGASPASPWDSIYNRLMQYRQSAVSSAEYPPEIRALKNELTRFMLGDQAAFSELTQRHITLDDLIAIRERLIGTGRIGGKAAGMLLARRILTDYRGEVDFTAILEPHDSFYIGSDVFFTFLVNNGLFELRIQLTRSCNLSRQTFDDVQQRFLEGEFPPEIMEQFRNMLDYFGQAPIIVRSSSLMEDSLGNAFAGKYFSEFCANQGSPEERLSAFTRAVKTVYASALNPDAVAYRQRQGLAESDEQMAVLVQRVSGMPYKQYFFPGVAGVGFSHNMYAWTSRIDPARGMLRLVFGLGTRAVNRMDGDYTRVVALSHPELRPEIGDRVVRYSQHNVDVLDLSQNRLMTLGTAELLGPDYEYPGLELLASVVKDGMVRGLESLLASDTVSSITITFDELLSKTGFVNIMDNMLSVLEQAYGHPVDTEFTAYINSEGSVRVNLLQCRSLRLPGGSASAEIPQNLPEERVLFRSGQFLSGGIVSDVRYILYVDPEAYSSQSSPDMKRQLGRVIGRLNQLPQIAQGRVILIGPGRWGSTNLELGVNVGYSDISNVAVLTEMADEAAGRLPELSYGTHFFQDLVESQIIYVAVYPQQADAHFNRKFFSRAPNVLRSVMPEASPFSSLIRLIDVPAATGGLHAQLAADSGSRQVICYLA